MTAILRSTVLAQSSVRAQPSTIPAAALSRCVICKFFHQHAAVPLGGQMPSRPRSPAQQACQLIEAPHLINGTCSVVHVMAEQLIDTADATGHPKEQAVEGVATICSALQQSVLLSLWHQQHYLCAAALSVSRSRQLVLQHSRLNDTRTPGIICVKVELDCLRYHALRPVPNFLRPFPC